MRSWFAIAPLLPWVRAYSRNVPKSPGLTVLPGARPGAFDCVGEYALRFVGIAPAPDAHPFLGLQVFVVGEEMLDLLHHDAGQILAPGDARIIREGGIDRNGDQFLVAAVLVLKEQHADRPDSNNTARNER